MSFSDSLRRLHETARDNPRDQNGDATRLVFLRDLKELIHHFTRLDTEIRTAHAERNTPFQPRVQAFMQKCFGRDVSADTMERNHRFLEESLELVQACGATASEAHQLVDYVFGRPVGEKSQEVGGVAVTLAALCSAQKIDMHHAGEVELARIWKIIDKIRAKWQTKPKHSPLPGSYP